MIKGGAASCANRAPALNVSCFCHLLDASGGPSCHYLHVGLVQAAPIGVQRAIKAFSVPGGFRALGLPLPDQVASGVVDLSTREASMQAGNPGTSEGTISSQSTCARSQ